MKNINEVAEGFKGTKKEDQIYRLMIAERAKRHSSEAFYALKDPPEVAVFSMLKSDLETPSK